jgi:hypothetical protein
MHLLFAVFLLLNQQPSQPPRAQQETSYSENNQKHASQVSPGSKSTGSTDKECPTHPSKSGDEYDARKDRLYRWYLLATIIGVCGGFVGIAILIGQTIVTQRSAKAAKDAAIAAKSSTDALIRSERAWIFADIEKTPTSGRTIHNSKRTSISIRVKCRNVGNAPAWITEIRAKFKVAKVLPLKPQLDISDTLHAEPFPIAPNDPPFISKDQFLVVDGIQELDSDGEIFVVYGSVLYRDVFSDNRETTFGYRLLPGTDTRFERLSGLTAYNKNF